MAIVKFLKDHPSGIKEGSEHNVTEAHAKRLANDGFIDLDGDGEKDADEPSNPLGLDPATSVQLKVTKKFLAENPQLKDGGIKVGDIILVAAPAE